MDAKKGIDRKLVVEAVGEREVVMTRVVAAPRHLVFDAWTKPDQVPRWLTGPDGWTMPICKIDLRVGGVYRYIMHGPNGMKLGMKGSFREIARPDRLVSTESMDDGNDDGPQGAVALYPGEAVNTLTLVESGGLTTMTLRSIYPSAEARDGALQSGMEEGVAVSYDRMEAMLAALAA